jgi:hypothetical protein
VDPRDILAFVSRDWQAVEKRKSDYWAARKREMTPLEALEIADDLWRYVRSIRPDWPSERERAEDLANHVRVSELLSRVR